MENLYIDALDFAGNSPYLLALVIAGFTFILEDAATVTAGVLAFEGVIHWSAGLGALFVGIVLGDLWLYSMGWAATRYRWAQKIVEKKGAQKVKGFINNRVFAAVFTARFIPGLRLPTYLACGLFQVNLKEFLLATIVAATVWTGCLFALIYHLGPKVIELIGPYRWVFAPTLIVFFISLPYIIRGIKHLAVLTKKG